MFAQPAVRWSIGGEYGGSTEVESGIVLCHVLAVVHTAHHGLGRPEIPAIDHVDGGSVIGSDEVTGLDRRGSRAFDRPVTPSGQDFTGEARPRHVPPSDRGEGEHLVGTTANVDFLGHVDPDLESELEPRCGSGRWTHPISPDRTDREIDSPCSPPTSAVWVFGIVSTPSVQGSRPVPGCSRNSG